MLLITKKEIVFNLGKSTTFRFEIFSVNPSRTPLVKFNNGIVHQKTAPYAYNLS